MNRIDSTFMRLRHAKQKALIVYLMGGDPDLAVTESLILNVARGGADVVEIGLPFSDPMAEGTVIQAASQRSLAKGYSFEDFLQMVRRVREKVDIPLLLMNYYNLVLNQGEEAFISKAAQVGIDGLIVPDLPMEEATSLSQSATGHGLHLISFLAPTSRSRTSKLIDNATGFLYCISSRGVTGARQSFSNDAEEYFEQIAKITSIPTAIGFGIGSPEQAGQVMQYADGVIVGSALVEAIAQVTGSAAKCRQAFTFCQAFSKVVHRG